MLNIIFLILVVDTVMLAIHAVQCNPEATGYLIPLYALLLVGYAAIYRIFIKMKGGRREQLSDRVQRLREENLKLKEEAEKKQKNPTE